MTFDYLDKTGLGEVWSRITSLFARKTELTQALSAESSARSKADELLQQGVDAKMAPDDVVAGENVSVQVGETGTVTISAEPGLPDGGTTGQVLTKTSGGEAWADVPQPDMTGVVKAEGESEKTLKVDGETVDAISLLQGITIGQSSTFSIRDIGNQLQALAFSAGDGGIGNVAITCEPGSAGIQIGTIAERVTFGFYQNGPAFSLSRDKSVNSITDAIPDSPTGNALVTDKAVADYVSANAPSVTLPLPVSQGGTGATTADGARTALGISVADPDELVEYVKSKLGGA